MPLFEYRCSACETRFERFVSSEEPIACPRCDSSAIRRLLSVFAVASGRTSTMNRSEPSGCGSCGDPRGPGACSMN